MYNILFIISSTNIIPAVNVQRFKFLPSKAYVDFLHHTFEKSRHYRCLYTIIQRKNMNYS